MASYCIAFPRISYQHVPSIRLAGELLKYDYQHVYIGGRKKYMKEFSLQLADIFIHVAPIVRARLTYISNRKQPFHHSKSESY